MLHNSPQGSDFTLGLDFLSIKPQDWLSCTLSSASSSTNSTNSTSSYSSSFSSSSSSSYSYNQDDQSKNSNKDFGFISLTDEQERSFNNHWLESNLNLKANKSNYFNDTEIEVKYNISDESCNGNKINNNHAHNDNDESFMETNLSTKNDDVNHSKESNNLYKNASIDFNNITKCGSILCQKSSSSFNLLKDKKWSSSKVNQSRPWSIKTIRHSNGRQSNPNITHDQNKTLVFGFNNASLKYQIALQLNILNQNDQKTNFELEKLQSIINGTSLWNHQENIKIDDDPSKFTRIQNNQFYNTNADKLKLFKKNNQIDFTQSKFVNPSGNTNYHRSYSSSPIQKHQNIYKNSLHHDNNNYNRQNTLNTNIINRSQQRINGSLMNHIALQRQFEHKMMTIEQSSYFISRNNDKNGCLMDASIWEFDV